MSDFVSVKEVCQQLKLSRWTVIRAIQSNQIKGAVKVTGTGTRGSWRIPVTSYQEWIYTHSVPQTSTETEAEPS